jgi:hypothetical protein
MQRVWRAVLVTVVFVLCATPAAVAGARGEGRIQPADHVRGSTGGELLAEWWVKVAEQPLGQNPFEGLGERCLVLGRKGGVLGPVTGPTTCTVQAGTPVLLIGFTAECSDVEEPPAFAKGEQAQQACAEEQNQGRAEATLVTLDGGTPVNIQRDRFELVSPQTMFELPENNIFGVPGQEVTFAAHAWAAVIRGLRPGSHVVEMQFVGTGSTTLTLDVVKGPHG